MQWQHAALAPIYSLYGRPCCMTQHYITYCWDFPFLAMSLLRKLKRPFPWIANWFAYLCVLMDNTPSCQEEIKKNQSHTNYSLNYYYYAHAYKMSICIIFVQIKQNFQSNLIKIKIGFFTFYFQRIMSNADEIDVSIFFNT